MVTFAKTTIAGILALALCASYPLHATTVMSPEGATLHQLTVAVELYPQLYNGREIRSWAQVREVFNLDSANKSLRGTPSYPLEEHYEFIEREVPYPGYEGSRVKMLRVVPLQRADGQPKWRNLVIQTKDGNLTATRMSEEEVQTMFKQAGVPLPNPRPGQAAVEIEAMPKLDEPPPPQSSATPPVASRAPSTPIPIVIPRRLSPDPAVAESPASVVEHKSPLWPWLVGILALIVVGALVLKRRA